MNTLTPWEYCQKWVELSPNQRGFRKACVDVLAEATGLSPRTIGNWGKQFEKHPDHVLRTLSLADQLNQIKKIVS
ncbi:MAG: hypothetical protein QNJ55_33625 [Xenococcus sp. MO_188.B8]|nr:hypothetical protein [Xenococcus sp. MO_188.B8]